MTEPVTPAAPVKRKVWRAPHPCSERTERKLLGDIRKRAFSGDVAAMEVLIRLGREKRQEDERKEKRLARMEKARLASQRNRDEKKAAKAKEVAASE